MKTAISKIRFIVALMAICSAGSSYAAEQKSQNNHNEIIGKSKTLQKQFIRDDIISLQVKETTVNKIGLQQIIDEMQRLQMPSLDDTETEDQKAAASDDQSVKTQSTSEIVPPANIVPAKPQPKKTGNVSKQILDKLLENPGKIVDPLSTAQALFLNDKMMDAAKFYQIALQRNDSTDKTDSTDSTDKTDNVYDRQWILFQIGNCLRKDDPDRAHKYYQQLIEEYPSSGWATAARTCQEVITWYKQNSPSVILEKYTSDPNSI